MLEAPVMTEARVTTRVPWAWIPSLYLAEGLPYVVVMTVSVIMYKGFGISNTDIALYTSWLYLPWVIKPFWSPVVDLLGTRRRWIWVMQLLIGGGLGGVALAIPMPHMFQWTLAIFWLMAFNSATHDIAADGFYMLATTPSEQAFFVGVRNMFYRGATIFGQGLIVTFAGLIEKQSGSKTHAWTLAMAVLAGLFLLFGLWHAWALPRPAVDRPGNVRRFPEFVKEFVATFGSFFRKPGIVTIVAFLLLYRLGEAQLVKMVAPFLLDARDQGGLALSTASVGIVYGTFGILALTLGGIAGGIVASRDGLKRWLWPMLFAIHVPDAVFIYLAYTQPTNVWIIQACVVLEQFGYGFGFTAFLLYMIHIARGEHQTAHYAICTGFMAMGMMFPGMWSGWLQDHIGYRHFFVWVILATVPSFLVATRIPLDDEFGKKAAA
ncbi:MAG TPA: MFS transporter [Candidatus Eisenbacteria bacterium]|jgi:PAT family beta-lactamase induction signal transducer AmpG